jgi:hypothetical protein
VPEPQSFEDLRAYVEALIETGEPFEIVEQAIAAYGLPEDAESALWLVAWSLAGRGVRSPRRRRLRVVPA